MPSALKQAWPGVLLIPNGQMSDSSKDFRFCAGEVSNDDNASASSMQPKDEGATRNPPRALFTRSLHFQSRLWSKCRVHCRGFVSNHASAQYGQVTRAVVRCLWQFVAEVSDVGVIREGSVRR